MTYKYLYSAALKNTQDDIPCAMWGVRRAKKGEKGETTYILSKIVNRRKVHKARP